jgi:indole-3-acetate monooxygenase
LHNAIAWAAKIPSVADEIEEGRRIPEPIANGMKEAGIFDMAMPSAWGGPELDPLTQFRVIEALATADGSVGWCAMINCDGGYVTAFLSQDVGRAMYSDIRVGTAAAATPTGQAIPGTWRISCERTFSIRQRLPSLRMGLAGLRRCRGWITPRR